MLNNAALPLLGQKKDQSSFFSEAESSYSTASRMMSIVTLVVAAGWQLLIVV